MTQALFIQPQDVLYLRGNHLFGDAGAHSAAQMPPWPSMMAGALRSSLIADTPVDFQSFGKGAELPAAYHSCLGTVRVPGDFRLNRFGLGIKEKSGIKPVMPCPDDIFIAQGERTDTAPQNVVQSQPKNIKQLEHVNSSALLNAQSVLRLKARKKASSDWWLNSDGIEAYLNGHALKSEQHFIRRSELWKTENRLGIAMDYDKGSTKEGAIYTSEVVSLSDNVGFYAEVEGDHGLLAKERLLRLGGDGRSAHGTPCDVALSAPDWGAMGDDARFKLVLASPAIFTQGWLPDGITTEGNDHILSIQGLRARLVASTVNRAGTISGWDLAKGRPKPARLTAAVGSVYWFEILEGSIHALENAHRQGLWDTQNPDQRHRRPEGFNQIHLARWARS